MSKHHEKLTPMSLNPQNRCFACGPANPGGLQMDIFLTEDRTVVITPVLPPAYDGHPGYVHGGIIATMLDEAMSKSVRARGCPASMTRHMEIDYLRPVPSSAPLRIEGRVTHHEGRKHWSEAKILNANGTVLAQSKGLFVQISPERLKSQAVTKPPTS